MANIVPFRGIRFNKHKVQDLSKVVTQPYDRIRTDLQDRYYDLHPYNIVRIIKGRELETDTPDGENVYTRAADYCRAWLDAGYLQRGAKPALYVYHQTFTLPNGGERSCPSGWKESFNGKNWEVTTWWRITCWRGLAETVAAFVTKGKQVFIEGVMQGEADDGSLNPRVWTGNDGVAKASFELRADTVKFLGERGENGPSEGPGAPTSVDDLPF